MTRVLMSFMVLVGFNFSQAAALAAKNGNQKKQSSANHDYFSEASKDFKSLLSNPVFKDYPGYTIDNIRQGEIGESQAYFVRLVKPFSSNNEGVCFSFLGVTEIQGKPHSCEKAE
ncbi:hypothetical protein [Bdellovibrio sp. HCB337]|uniref:hypothetical protein n=1 Tax=Bdellovibrio sp. HCB337 TaxID=3394358 RepID=UPI0039A64BFE